MFIQTGAGVFRRGLTRFWGGRWVMRLSREGHVFERSQTELSHTGTRKGAGQGIGDTHTRI